MKLSKRQKEAIQYMRDGYELGNSTGWGASVWLQFGGCGKGGDTAKITYGTFGAIVYKKLVELIPNQSPFARPQRYQLTELGKTIQL